ncbi:MAG: hypothetical protein CMI96_04275 [Pelagibacteraceae bacterium]|nr:hypothetical protein [Pelagibacteraceae bacterium]|tara:strand:- start:22888 stop:23634 length:747 start_codon:yes stop_codon:yes gene_type:complete
MSYTDLEFELFSRQFILKDYTNEKIDKLENLKITIVGLGGIGCPLSLYLIASGVKNLTIIDGDKIEKSNLNRQILFSINDLNKQKVDVAKNRLQKINPNANIQIINENIKKSNISILFNSSIIIDTTDDWNNTKIINEYCSIHALKFIFCSVIGNDVQLGLFDNNKKHHICLNCLFPNKNDIDLPRCEKVGVNGIAAGIAGLLAAQKTLNYLLNFNKEVNIITLFDVKKNNVNKIRVKKNNKCYLNNI